MHRATSRGRTITGIGGLAVLSFVFSAAPLAGCGGDDDAGMAISTDVPFSSSLPRGARIGEMTRDQQVTLCTEVRAFASGVSSCGEEVTCRFFGITAAALVRPTTDAEARAACTGAYQECRAQLLAKTFSASECSTAMASPSCTATVGELAACLDDLGDVIDMERGAPPFCGSLTLAQVERSALSADGGAVSAPGSVPQTCQTVTRKCHGT